MKGKQQQDFRTEKYIRYGIRKYSFGAASVAIAAGLMFLGNGAVSATEVQAAEASVAATAPAEKLIKILQKRNLRLQKLKKQKLKKQNLKLK